MRASYGVVGNFLRLNARCVGITDTICRGSTAGCLWPALVCFLFGSAAGAIAAEPLKTFRCRLVNVTIPADSPLRNYTEINHPPVLYVLVKKNGVQLANYSSQVKGWSVDFPKGKPENEWEIAEDADDRYAIELWDSNWGEDDLALTITGLKAQDFRGTICEAGPKGMSKDRLVTITFVAVPTPEAAIGSYAAEPKSK